MIGGCDGEGRKTEDGRRETEMKKYLDDVLVIFGAGLITAGFYIVDPVLALFSAGIFLIIFGVMIGFGQRGEE